MFDESSRSQVLAGTLQLCWLGQAGFAFRDAADQVTVVDPYLSNAVERLHGFKRLSPAPFSAEAIRCDLLVLSHEHADHLDPDAVPVIVKNNPECRVAASSGCLPVLRDQGAPENRITVLEPDAPVKLGSVLIHPGSADHGDEAPTALCFVLEFEGIRVFYTGDTALRPARFQKLIDMRPNILLPCINGGFGNMNHLDAAMLAQQCGPALAIPCHFWTFAEQGVADPAGFMHACKHFCPNVETRLLTPGEVFTFETGTTK